MSASSRRAALHAVRPKMPVVRAVHERFDLLREQAVTTVTGDAWEGGPTFELTDSGGRLAGGLDGA